eukprot:851848-Prorocentrum_minimum.AAC.2
MSRYDLDVTNPPTRAAHMSRYAVYVTYQPTRCSALITRALIRALITYLNGRDSLEWVGWYQQVIDRILYKLDDLVRPFVHKILVVIEPLLIDEDYYARVEGREIISNLSKVRTPPRHRDSHLKQSPDRPRVRPPTPRPESPPPPPPPSRATPVGGRPRGRDSNPRARGHHLFDRTAPQI